MAHQLPELSELSQWEVVTKETCHPVHRGEGGGRGEGRQGVGKAPIVAAMTAVREWVAFAEPRL